MSGSAAAVFDAKIKGVDEASGAVQKITSGVKRLIESTRGLTQATKGLTAANAAGTAAHTRFIASLSTHVRLLHGHLGSVNAGIAGIRNSVASLLPMIGALGAGASLAGLFALTKAAAESSHEMGALSKRLGIGAGDIGALKYASKMSGVDGDSMVGGLEKLNKTLGTAAVGKNKVAVALFKHLGINLRDAGGHIRTTAQLMPQLADAFQKTQDPAMRAFMATTLFGKSGQELLPVLMQGGKALAEFAEEGKKLIYEATSEQKRALVEFQDNWIGLETAISGFKKEVGASLAPIFAPIVKAMKEWVAANRHWIATKIHDKVKALSDALKLVDWDKVITGTTRWIEETITLIDKLGGVPTVLAAIGLAMGSPLISAVAGAIAIFRSLAATLWVVAAAAWANPIILAIAGLIAAAVLLWYNWNWVKEKLAAIFRWFEGQDEWVKILVRAINPLIGLPLAIMEAWRPLVDFFSNIFDKIGSAFEKFSSYMKSSAGDWTRFGQSYSATAIPQGGPRIIAPSLPRSQAPSQMPTFDAPEGAPSGGGGSLIRRQSAVEPSPVNGNVGVRIAFDNLPPGARYTTTSSGRASIDEMSVGYMSPMPA